VELLASGPARAFGLPAGTLRPGAAADVTLLDLEKPYRVEPRELRSKGRSTPFAGWELRGRAVGTWVGGRRVTLP
jgi:dihydroorotase